MKIIDFHTHPFLYQKQSIVMYKDALSLEPDSFRELLRTRGIEIFCGAVTEPNHPTGKEETWTAIKACNDTAFALQERYGGSYIPGVQVHPDYVAESCAEIDRAIAHGSRLIGEICWYIDGWQFDNRGLDEIFDYAAEKGMIVSVHPSDDDSMNALLLRHRDLCIVGAHPGDWSRYFAQAERMRMCENYLLDISAHGIERLGSLKKLVDMFGSERILFGSDFPSCDPAFFIAGVLEDPYLSARDKENILFRNAERILNIDE